ncbi:cellulose binding domain-containing protein [Phytohabitans flavus]|uniref:rhamnogalacturonan endolyase family protein n=1 Tax=Phytohabitans flavus TaxID=1076124 RepID=UPI00363BD184
MLTSRRRFALLSSTLAGTVAGAGVLAAVVATAASAAAGCRVDYAVTNQWQGGFGASVTITNLGDPIDRWSLVWSYTAGQAVTQAWNATVTQSGAQVTAVDAGYNGAIPTNGTASFGFNGSWNNSSNPVPASFVLNGTSCTGAVGTPTTGAPPPTTTAPPPPTTTPPPPAGNAKQMEDLNRGLVSVRSGSANLVSWRLLGTEAASTGFNVYRGGTKVTATPITNSTNYLDSGAAANASYTVRAVVNGTEQAASEASSPSRTGTSTCRSRHRPAGTRRTTRPSATSTATGSTRSCSSGTRTTPRTTRRRA